MQAARARLDVATHNLANLSTDGFRRLVARGRLTSRGVEIDASASSRRDAYRHTGRAFDLAIVGEGAVRVRSADGTVSATRNGAFERDRYGVLRDPQGRALLGVHGPLCVPDGASIDDRGRVMLRGAPLGRIAIGNGVTMRSGFLETSNADAIGEMIDVLGAQRSFETAEKVVAAIDGVRQKSGNDVARVK